MDHNFIRLRGFNICGSFEIRERDLLHQSLKMKVLEGRNVKMIKALQGK